MNQVTLGGDRLGSGKKQKVTLHGFERSTHDLSYIWRSTMAAGTLVPFLSEVALPGDTFDIELNVNGKTHPTVGPLFGSYKMQLDTFVIPMRLYHSGLHNNMLGIGMNMSQIKLPKFQLAAKAVTSEALKDLDNFQVNPSSVFAYLGLRGVGIVPEAEAATETQFRKFNAIPWLGLWEIYKQYYSNKQEEEGVVIHTPAVIDQTWIDLSNSPAVNGGQIQKAPATVITSFITATGKVYIEVSAGSDDIAQSAYTSVFFTDGTVCSLDQLVGGNWVRTSLLEYYGEVQPAYEGKTIINWDYMNPNTVATVPIRLERFPLSNIDDMRMAILAEPFTNEFLVNTLNKPPYSLALEVGGEIPDIITSCSWTQEGLPVKTYQSDLFNNWLSTEWIDGPGGINEITAVDTSDGNFSIDALNLSKKVYDMLNRIAVSGGSYDDWLNAVYDHESWHRAESPVYMGGLIRELAFSEVVSNSQDGDQPLGTLAGKGIMTDKVKGGKVVIRVDEPSYILGIVSLTPRLDYSQGNKWDLNLDTLDDLHKPNLDEIGFQELYVYSTMPSAP